MTNYERDEAALWYHERPDLEFDQQAEYYDEPEPPEWYRVPNTEHVPPPLADTHVCTWRYSNSRDVFYCTVCYRQQDPDTGKDLRSDD